MQMSAWHPQIYLRIMKRWKATGLPWPYHGRPSLPQMTARGASGGVVSLMPGPPYRPTKRIIHCIQRLFTVKPKISGHKMFIFAKVQVFAVHLLQLLGVVKSPFVKLFFFQEFYEVCELQIQKSGSDIDVIIQ